MVSVELVFLGRVLVFLDVVGSLVFFLDDAEVVEQGGGGVV